MKGHDDENAQWFKYMMKDLFKQKFEVEERCLISPYQCSSKKRYRPNSKEKPVTKFEDDLKYL